MKELILSISYTILITCCILMVKNEVTYRMHRKISEAIFHYKMWCIDNGCASYRNRVNFWDTESYYATVLRIWDWGYKRILPPEKFALIEPFIK